MAGNMGRTKKPEGWHPSTEPYAGEAPLNPMHPRPGTPREVIEAFWGPDDPEHERRVRRGLGVS